MQSKIKYIELPRKIKFIIFENEKQNEKIIIVNKSYKRKEKQIEFKKY